MSFKGAIVITEGGLEIPVKELALRKGCFVTIGEGIRVTSKVRAILGRNFQYVIIDNDRQVVSFSDEHPALDFSGILDGDTLALSINSEVTGKRSTTR